MIEVALLLAGVLCVRHGVRGIRAQVRAWAAERLERIARTDMREWYRQEP